MASGDRAAEIEAVGADRAAAVMEPQPDFGELLGLPAVPETAQARLARRPGRPAGARNKRAEALAVELERRFGSALLRAYAIATMPTDELAARLGCHPIEALQEQRLQLQVAAPYVYQRQPLAVQHSGQVVHLTLGEVPAPPTVDGASLGLGVVETVENQDVGEDDDAAV
jgi:hypothetical protein